MKSQGYSRINEYSCLYIERCFDGTYVILIQYVDDMLKLWLIKITTSYPCLGFDMGCHKERVCA